MLRGEFEINCDEKGRISIPNKFKEELYNQKLHLTKGFGERCLWILMDSTFRAIEETLYSEKVSILNADVMAIQRLIIAPCEDFEIQNKNDRLLIPQSLRSHANILPKSNLIILGLINRLEIWEAGEYAKYCEESISNLKNNNTKIWELLNV